MRAQLGELAFGKLGKPMEETCAILFLIKRICYFTVCFLKN